MLNAVKNQHWRFWGRFQAPFCGDFKSPVYKTTGDYGRFEIALETVAKIVAKIAAKTPVYTGLYG